MLSSATLRRRWILSRRPSGNVERLRLTYNKGTMSRKNMYAAGKRGSVFINPFSYQPVDDQLSVDC